MKLPNFCVVDLSRLRAVDTNHCDVSAVFAELQALCAELRQIVTLHEEVEETALMALMVPSLSDFSNVAKHVQPLQTEVHSLQQEDADDVLSDGHTR